MKVYLTATGGRIEADSINRARQIARDYKMGRVTGSIDKSEIWCIFDPMFIKIISTGFESKARAQQVRRRRALSSRYKIITHAHAEQVMHRPKAGDNYK